MQRYSAKIFFMVERTGEGRGELRVVREGVLEQGREEAWRALIPAHAARARGRRGGGGGGGARGGFGGVGGGVLGRGGEGGGRALIPAHAAAVEGIERGLVEAGLP